MHVEQAAVLVVAAVPAWHSVHEDWPGLAATFPAVQSSHSLWSGLSCLPVGQSWHVFNDPVWYWPGRHWSHCVALLATLGSVPNGQFVQGTPFGEYCPAAQSSHCEYNGSFGCVPAKQGVQDVGDAQMVPGCTTLHLTHAERPGVVVTPSDAVQSWHVPPVPYLPGGQAKQAGDE